MTKKILILASNSNNDLPNIYPEIRDLKAAIKRNKDFIVEIEPAVQAEDIQKHFHEYHPYIVHFCGHGAGEDGLVLDRGKLLSNNALSGLFKIFGEEIECVLLNACTTETQADAIGEHIPYVIGTSREILDRAAYLFAVGFYEALGYGENIERCYELGCNAIEIGLNKAQLVPLENSETPRKFEVIDEEGAIANDESKNIVLLKINPAVNTSELSSIIPPKFSETILEEVDRKDYYDNLRNVLDNFGQTTIKREKPISKFEYEQRQTFLKKVQEFWIKGFLKPSLYFNTAVDATEDDPSGQILRPLDNIEVIPFNIDDSYDELKQTDITGQISDGKTLLILGNPGSGKTIALLQLAERLIKQTQQDMTKPIPVVFNLSSWGEKQQPLEEWLIEELKDKYQVPKTWSEPWIKEQQLTLLLDGLDEVKENHRNACVRAINKFIADDHLETEIVVCSRVKDYEALTERLLLSSAICIQPLSKQQLLDFLENADDSLLGLKTVIEQHKEIAEFAQTPLILNMMTWTYQGWSTEQCRMQFSIAKDRLSNLFESYISKNVNIEKKYSKYRVLHWLNWLGITMVNESKILFLIENLQPTLLQSKKERIAYQIQVFLCLGVVGGLILGLTASLTFGLIGGLTFNLVEPIEGLYGLIAGLLFGIVVSLTLGLLGGAISLLMPSFISKIFLFEQIHWSWKKVKSKIILKVSIVLIFWSILFSFREFNLLAFLIFVGGVVSVLNIINSGFNPSEIEHKIVSNQGIKRSAVNSITIGLIGGFIFGLIVFLIAKLDENGFESDELSPVWMIGCICLLFLCFRNGGFSCIQHFNLRQILYRKGRIPWNYARFLDYATKLRLMKKVGGGYVFYHRMLMEHFANIELNKSTMTK